MHKILNQGAMFAGHGVQIKDESKGTIFIGVLHILHPPTQDLKSFSIDLMWRAKHIFNSKEEILLNGKIWRFEEGQKNVEMVLPIEGFICERHLSQEGSLRFVTLKSVTERLSVNLYTRNADFHPRESSVRSWIEVPKQQVESAAVC